MSSSKLLEEIFSDPFIPLASGIDRSSKSQVSAAPKGNL